MLTDAQMKWLFLEGLVPIFGAGFFYILWGVMRYLTSSAATPFSFAWKEAVDSLGWLSGILIIAIQSAIRGWDAADGHWLSYGCIGGALLCFMLLLSAMNDRGQNPAWQPPLSTKLASILLVVGLLFAACRAQLVPLPKHDESALQGARSTTAATDVGGGKS
jgi:hypothetical protein